MPKIQQKNVLICHKKKLNLCKFFKNRAKIRYLQRDYKKLQESYINSKGVGKGYVWPHIGPEWRKVAEIG